MSLEVSSRAGDFVPETGYGTDFGRSTPSVGQPQIEAYEPGAGYGAKRRPNAAGIAATVAVHVVLFAGLLQLGAQFTEQKAERLVAVDLRPPPPPPSQETPPPPPREEIVAVKPPIEIPRPEPIAVVVEPDPVVAPAAVALSAPRSDPPAQSSAPAPGPSLIDASDLGTRMISGEAPRYPTESRRKREQGTVVLSLIVGTDGKVADINVSQSSGFHRLDRAALDAVRRWRWAPTIRNGRPVMVRGVLSIPFVLTEKA